MLVGQAVGRIAVGDDVNAWGASTPGNRLWSRLLLFVPAVISEQLLDRYLGNRRVSQETRKPGGQFPPGPW